VEDFKKLIVEFIGTFALIFFGAGSIVATGGSDLVAIALAHGLAIGLMVMAAGHISGGVYNPSLTIGLVAARQMKPTIGAQYIVAQLLGAIVAAGALKLAFAAEAVDKVKLGTPVLGSGVSVGQGILVEAILTFFLMFAVFGNAVDPRSSKALPGLMIGLIITMDILAGGGLTGAAMNPARSIGPEIVQGVWDGWWIYWVGPVVGAVAAAVLYNEVLLGSPAPAKGPERAPERTPDRTADRRRRA
jgi:aquaporin Z